MSLGDRIARQIAASGPITVAQFMALALHDPAEGYYRHAQAVGRSGDFITAPEISQVFGELLGIWCIEQWQRLGQPRPFKLIELGPGRGTLAADVLRAIALVPELVPEIHLVEVNAVLREQQRAALAGRAATWHETFDGVPPGPFLLLANEFFDALPIRQFERAPDAWRERLIELDGAGALAFTLSGPVPAALIPEQSRAAPTGSVVEIATAAEALLSTIAERVRAGPGVALVVDYGYRQSPLRGTLQALRRHERVDPLSEPGATDLSALVDFGTLAAVARRVGAVVEGPVTQAELLTNLGAAKRFAALRQANPGKAVALDAAQHRLMASDQMGDLFKAMAILPPGA